MCVSKIRLQYNRLPFALLEVLPRTTATEAGSSSSTMDVKRILNSSAWMSLYGTWSESIQAGFYMHVVIFIVAGTDVRATTKPPPQSGHQRVTSQLRRPYPHKVTHLVLELRAHGARMRETMTLVCARPSHSVRLEAQNTLYEHILTGDAWRLHAQRQQIKIWK